MKQPAVKFKGKVYAASPRHLNAINEVFKAMTSHQKYRVSNRIAEGKDKMLFGWIDENGKWEHDSEYQDARMIMYGFEKY